MTPSIPRASARAIRVLIADDHADGGTYVVLVARGHSNKEIASTLDVSVKAVETHKANGMEKLGLNSRAALVRFALAEGWLASKGTAYVDVASKAKNP